MRTLLIALSFVLPAHSWYPQTCCGENDCKSIPCDELVEDNNGWWKYLPTGNEFHPSMVSPSQDRHCHVCISSGKQSRCAFILSGV